MNLFLLYLNKHLKYRSGSKGICQKVGITLYINDLRLSSLGINWEHPKYGPFSLTRVYFLKQRRQILSNFSTVRVQEIHIRVFSTRLSSSSCDLPGSVRSLTFARPCPFGPRRRTKRRMSLFREAHPSHMGPVRHWDFQWPDTGDYFRHLLSFTFTWQSQNFL